MNFLCVYRLAHILKVSLRTKHQWEEHLEKGINKWLPVTHKYYSSSSIHWIVLEKLTYSKNIRPSCRQFSSMCSIVVQSFLLAFIDIGRSSWSASYLPTTSTHCTATTWRMRRGNRWSCLFVCGERRPLVGGRSNWGNRETDLHSGWVETREGGGSSYISQYWFWICEQMTTISAFCNRVINSQWVHWLSYRCIIAILITSLVLEWCVYRSCNFQTTYLHTDVFWLQAPHEDGGGGCVRWSGWGQQVLASCLLHLLRL